MVLFVPVYNSLLHPFSRQKTKEGRRIQSRGLSTTEYEGLEMANEKKKIREVNRAIHRPL